MQKPELMVAVRDFETLKTAIDSGADAIEIAGEEFGFLSAASHRFSNKEIRRAVTIAHEKGVRLFVAANIIAHHQDIEKLRRFLKELVELQADGVIVADPGVLLTVQETAPELTIHVNMEMGITNWQSVQFWADAGASRVVLAKELNFANIQEICENVSAEIESQVHGPICIFYTGRQILTNYHRYRGTEPEHEQEITHYALKEEKRSEDYYPVYEDERGTYVMSSADLCLIEYIPELATAGLASFRIETRPYGTQHVRAVVSAYREAVETYVQYPENYRFRQEWLERIQKVSKRPFMQGFYNRESAK